MKDRLRRRSAKTGVLGLVESDPDRQRRPVLEQGGHPIGRCRSGEAALDFPGHGSADREQTRAGILAERRSGGQTSDCNRRPAPPGAGRRLPGRRGRGDGEEGEPTGGTSASGTYIGTPARASCSRGEAGGGSPWTATRRRCWPTSGPRRSRGSARRRSTPWCSPGTDARSMAPATRELRAARRRAGTGY